MRAFALYAAGFALSLGGRLVLQGITFVLVARALGNPRAARHGSPARP